VPRSRCRTVSSKASAGPPYVTDDPEPVEYLHWEMYLASQAFHDIDGWIGTTLHVDWNDGALQTRVTQVIEDAGSSE
jgi:hypothetical protein